MDNKDQQQYVVTLSQEHAKKLHQYAMLHGLQIEQALKKAALERVNEKIKTPADEKETS